MVLRRVVQSFVALIIVTGALGARATILQEGWYKVTSGGQHVGFIALRYEFDDKKKQFISTSFTQTSPLAGDLKESLTATSDHKLAPVSYMFTSKIGQLTKIIDASFSKDNLVAKVTTGEKSENVQWKLQKGTFLSQFLLYVILQSKQGLKKGNNFAYSAVAEEDAKASKGEAYVSDMEKYHGVDAYKILVTYKGSKQINYVTPKGVMLMTKSPADSLMTELVGSVDDATKGFEVNKKTLNLLFKTLPAASLPAGFASATEPAKGEAGKIKPPAKDTIPQEKEAPPPAKGAKPQAGKGTESLPPKEDLPPASDK